MAASILYNCRAVKRNLYKCKDEAIGFSPDFSNRHGSLTLGAQLSQAQGVMPFCEAHARGIRYERAMIEGGRAQITRAIKL